MKLTVRKVEMMKWKKERVWQIEDAQGYIVGLITKIPNTRTEDHPYKLFVDGRLVTVSYGKRWTAAREDLLHVMRRRLQKNYNS